MATTSAYAAPPAAPPRARPAAVPEELLHEVCGRLFASLPRCDQQRKAEQYVRGLLSAQGRKSIRNIAAAGSGGAAAEQSLHHFVTSSTWDWEPVRRALAHHLARTLAPRAWVVSPLVIPKAGRHSVGVARRYVPGAGQVVNSQQAYGVWAAGERASAPVDWRLLLSGAWLSDAGLRERVRIPESVVQHGAPDDGDVTELALRIATAVEGGPRPVVVDLPDARLPAVADRCAAARTPFLLRVPNETEVTVTDAAVPGFGRRVVPADRLLHLLRPLRRPVEWPDHRAGVRRTCQVAAVRVAPAAGPVPRRPLLLVGEWEDVRRGPSACWLTDLADTPPAALLRLVKLRHRVTGDVADVCEPVGLLDFEGRSFTGWHRHVTLASVAHALRVLTPAEPLPAYGAPA